MRHTRKASYNYAEGCSVSEENQGRLGRLGLNFFLLLEFWQHGGGLRSVLWGVFKYKSGRN